MIWTVLNLYLFTFGELIIQDSSTLTSVFSFLSYIPSFSTFFLKTLSGSLLGALVENNSLLGFRSSIKQLEMVSNLGRKFSRKNI